jgi:hypothetical protein
MFTLLTHFVESRNFALIFDDKIVINNMITLEQIPGKNQK